jgi:hypothetical protein
MRALGSLIMSTADEHRVPAGSALAVDRERFAAEVTSRIAAHPNIEVLRERVDALPSTGSTIVATGPLTAPGLAGEAFTVYRERRPSRDAMLIGRRHDQRPKRPHFLVEKSNRIVFRIVGTETVRADHFRKPVRLMRRGSIAAAPHLGQADLQPSFGDLPSGLRTSQAAADDKNIISHGARLIASPYASP